MDIGFISLGCAKNRVDTEVMMGLLKKEGHRIVNTLERAEAVIINTCGFIEEAKQEAIDTILDTALLKNRGGLKYLLATGCLCQRYGEELFAEMPELDAVVGISYFTSINDIIAALEKGSRLMQVGPTSAFYEEAALRVLTTPPGSAYLKINEGCNNRCSYCTIPNIRGVLRSRSHQDIWREAKKLAASGIKELVLIAQDTAAYGLDQGSEPQLPTLLHELNNIDGLAWIRLMYLHPSHISSELIEAIAQHNKVLPYLDIPVQHADSDILKRMNRQYDAGFLRKLIKKVRSELDSPVLRTTIMVGFPGEDDNKFNTLLEFIEEIKFDWLGAFAFVPEEGTSAARMAGQIPEEIKQERLEQVLGLQRKISRQKNIDRINRLEKVLVSSQLDHSLYLGRAGFQAPEVDGVTLIRSEQKLKKGDFALVKLQAVRNNMDLIGEAVYESTE
ncbi:30S ribosomal protein S12 methylthiotransferase RimO [Syntrophomonas palmitatica]|uniref:30S ribosomal protein S12 methylthiotransferase RimO n=1 Tax=Syntrophomonas palmitatica TaxID=402877 RepID=UPI0006D27965|nr:30S ribosomal protein S12 methylthiotransferase RimO [Syntrophomonas palmitatica]